MARILANEKAKEIAGNPSTNPSTDTEGIKSPTDSSKSTLGKKKLAISCPETARLLGLSRNTIYELVRENKIPFIKYGKRILIPYGVLKRRFMINKMNFGFVFYRQSGYKSCHKLSIVIV